MEKRGASSVDFDSLPFIEITYNSEEDVSNAEIHELQGIYSLCLLFKKLHVLH